MVLINCIAVLYVLFIYFLNCISRLSNRDSTELLMEMEVPSDLSLSLLSSSKNVSRNATNIIPPPSNLQDQSELWPDTMSDSSKKNSKCNLCALRVLCSSKCPNQNLHLSHLIQKAERLPHPPHQALSVLKQRMLSVSHLWAQGREPESLWISAVVGKNLKHTSWSTDRMGLISVTSVREHLNTIISCKYGTCWHLSDSVMITDSPVQRF